MNKLVIAFSFGVVLMGSSTTLAQLNPKGSVEFDLCPYGLSVYESKNPNLIVLPIK